MCAAAVGCGGGGVSAPRTAPVSGAVLYKGKPIVGVTVTFHPKFDMGAVTFTPNGQTNKDGRFTLTTAAAGDGAPPGEYAVTFELLKGSADKAGRDIDVDVWKGKYADQGTAKTVTVQKGDNRLEPFNLDWPAAGARCERITSCGWRWRRGWRASPAGAGPPTPDRRGWPSTRSRAAS